MITLLCLASLALWAGIATVVVVERDGYRALPTDPLRIP